MNQLTTNFYDADTGELVEIKEGTVVNVHKSILSSAERRQLKTERSQLIANGKETPLEQPVMFEETKKEIILQKPNTQRPPSNQDQAPLTTPEMKW